jgi:hypothetical protein
MNGSGLKAHRVGDAKDLFTQHKVAGQKNHDNVNAEDLFTQHQVTEQQNGKPNGAKDQIGGLEPAPVVVEKDEELKLDDIEPATPANGAPQPYTDEIGFATSKTFQQMGLQQKDGNGEETARLALDTKVAAPMHKRVDSAMQGPETGIAGLGSDAETTTSALVEPANGKLGSASPPVSAEVVEAEVTVMPTVSKKNKKKKKKGMKD